MPKISRSKTIYQSLPDELATASLPDAKVVFSINVVVPKGMEKTAERFIKESQDDIRDAFKRYVKKETRKLTKKADEL